MSLFLCLLGFFPSISSSSPPLFLQGALVQVVLEPEGDGDEDEVEDEHGESHALGHLPVEDEDGEEDEEEHAEEDGDRADHPGGRHLILRRIQDELNFAF